MKARWVKAYGATPLHLLSLIACFALAGYAALQARTGAPPLRLAVWFLGAAIVHDLVLFPLYSLADRSLRRLAHPAQDDTASVALNYLRVPALISGLLFVLFYPLILRRSQGAYGNASGLDQGGYLAHWLLLTGIAFVGSAVVYLLARLRR